MSKVSELKKKVKVSINPGFIPKEGYKRVKFINTLTHDKYDPVLYGFCFYLYHDKQTGDVIVCHNGLEYATEEDYLVLSNLVKNFSKGEQRSSIV